jgi:hypothetical protein
MSKDTNDPRRGARAPDNPSRESATWADRTAEIEEGTESVRRTIVVGRPMDRRRRKVRIPIGIEKVLCAAAGDREFREQLLLARADALAGTGLKISDAEAMILKSVSEAALRTMIENIDLKRHKKRRFFRGIAAASLAATTATACIGENEMAAGGGAAPDWPDTVSDVGLASDQVETPPDTIELLDGPMDSAGNLADEITPLDVAEMSAGVDIKDPEDIVNVEVDVEDVQVYAGIPPMDTVDMDVDVQPMPAGIPPMDVTEE